LADGSNPCSLNATAFARYHRRLAVCGVEITHGILLSESDSGPVLSHAYVVIQIAAVPEIFILWPRAFDSWWLPRTSRLIESRASERECRECARAAVPAKSARPCGMLMVNDRLDHRSLRDRRRRSLRLSSGLRHRSARGPSSRFSRQSLARAQRHQRHDRNHANHVEHCCNLRFLVHRRTYLSGNLSKFPDGRPIRSGASSGCSKPRFRSITGGGSNTRTGGCW